MEFIEAAHHWDGREGQTPRYIILHGTAGGTSAEAVARNDFANPDDQASAHIVIGTDGVAVQCVKFSDAAWANGYPIAGSKHDAFWDRWINAGINLNLITLAAIEHCKPSTDNSDALTPAQKATSFALVKQLCEQYNIPKRWADENGGITGHYSIDGDSRARCPGPYPWDELFQYLQGENDLLPLTDPFVTTFFTVNSATSITCKSNGFQVIGGILGYWQKTQGAARLPQGPENYNIPGVVWQKFESGFIAYDPQHKLDNPGLGDSYMVKLDSDLAQTLLGTATLQSKIDAARKALA